MPEGEETAPAPEPPNVYPGPLGIWKNTNLTLLEQRLEARFAEQLQRDHAATLRAYRFRHGRIFDTDLARGLSEDWNRSNESRARYTSAVHNPASALINALFHQLLAEPKEAGGDMVLFMAGGGGSGKTTAVSTVAASLLDRAHLVYDTTLSRYEPAAEKVQAALAAGWAVVIVYVYRPYEAAVRGVIHRAVESGRTVPLNVLAADHIGAPETVLRLAREHAGNERVQVLVIDNSSDDVRQARVLADTEALDFLGKIRHNDTDTLTEQAEEVLNDEIRNRAGTLRAVPRYVAAALRRRYRRRTRPRDR